MKKTNFFAGVPYKEKENVKEEDCLLLPDHYILPKHGKLSQSVHEATISLLRQRNIYIHGPSGIGKDAFVQAFSYYTRTPAKVFHISPETDVQSWLYSLRIGGGDTYIKEGELLKALRDGYTCTDGSTIPYLILISDFDRASLDQSEYLRMILDSIEGKIIGIEGEVHKVFPGTTIVVTANTSGSGDYQGRFLSANPLDNSLLDRFERFFEFSWMDWEDEGPLLHKKFPKVFNKISWADEALKKSSKKLREAIDEEEISIEFGHRALCRWLGHCEDILHFFPEEHPSMIFKRGLNCYLDGMPNSRIKDLVSKFIDPFPPGGMIEEGDTTHIGPRLKI